MKLKDILSGKVNEVRMTPGRVQKIQRNLQKAIEALKDNFPKYKAAKESGDEKKLKKHTKIALDLTKKKKELEKDLDKALGRLSGGLYVVTAIKGEGASKRSSAMVASWISQASFEPPGITVAVAKDRAIESLMQVGDRFIINVLEVIIF